MLGIYTVEVRFGGRIDSDSKMTSWEAIRVVQTEDGLCLIQGSAVWDGGEEGRYMWKIFR